MSLHKSTITQFYFTAFTAEIVSLRCFKKVYMPDFLNHIINSALYQFNTKPNPDEICQ